jgi:hypothetical protein
MLARLELGNNWGATKLGSNHLSRANRLSFGCNCSPFCSPKLRDLSLSKPSVA